jgi:hypothetical protein
MQYYSGNMPKNTAPPPRLGIMQKVFAYENKEGGALLGSGWFIIRDDGKHMAPDLYDISGKKLPEGWYTLQVTGENHLVVIPRMVQ